MGSPARRLAAATGVLAALAVGVPVGRIVLHHQSDDRARVASKLRYLAGLAERGPSVALPPNLVVILFDDLGYGDVGAYGSPIRTPAIDRLAAEGALFRHGYSASPYCSAARAGLLTGRFAVRSGLDHVVQAPWTWRDLLLRLGWRNRRLPLEEITLAELLSAAGYATAAFGKWHLGDEPPSLPHQRGFDEFFGLLHSNDQGRPRVWRDGEVVERHPIDQATLTRRYTAEAERFLRRQQRDRPFFLYLPHTFPHVPLAAAADRLGRSPAGLYGDVVEELDDSVGRVVAALERQGLAERTLVVVTSDNGPWFQGGQGGVRGRKFEVFEGGTRVPLIAWGPGLVAARSIDEPVTALDLVPTMLEFAGLPAPTDRLLDGVSLAELLAGGPPPEREAIWYFQLGRLRAVRAGRFKYVDRRRLLYGNPMNWPLAPFVDRGPWLYDLSLDPDESYDVSQRHPEMRLRLSERLELERRRLADNRGGWLPAPAGGRG